MENCAYLRKNPGYAPADKLGVRTEKGILKHRKKVKEETMPIMVCNGSRAIKLIETQMLKNLGK